MNDTSSSPSPPRISQRSWTFLIVTGLGILVFGIGWRWWASQQLGDIEPSRRPVDNVDPRLTYPTPYKNVRPEVKYVGDQACGGCHREHAKSYRRHPMGQAMAPIAEATPIERYEAAALNPFTAQSLRYVVERRDGRAVHRESALDEKGGVIAEIEGEAEFAIGSGARARSYAVNRDGCLFESPITWYSHAGKWDLSPSYETRNQHFSRPILPGCLFCHCNYAEHVPGTVNRYHAPIFHGFAIGCERCHGPGELHVEKRRADDALEDLDDTIVNPSRLEHNLREDVCRQCHLQGEQRIVRRGGADFDYRPGLPLHLFLMDFVDARSRRADNKFVSSVEQMMASRCYAASREPNKLGCISCHDPHRQPTEAEKIAHYRDRCLHCHAEASCSLDISARRAKSPQDSCIACHMPRTSSEVNHTATTDHHVPRKPDTPAKVPIKQATPAASDLTPFAADRIDAKDEELSRNLGLAMIGMLDRGPPPEFARQYAEQGLPLLEKALKRDPKDWPAWEARGDALWVLERREEALTCYETILAARPDSERTLERAGELALELNRPQTTQTYLERGLRINPWRWHFPYRLAIAHFRQGSWQPALKACQTAVRLEPFRLPSRSLLVQCCLAAGESENARTEFETLRQLTPDGRRADLQAWFAEQTKRFQR